MEQILLWVLIAVGLLGLSLIQTKGRKSFLKKLSVLLYKEMNGDAFLALLNSFSGKLYMNAKTRLFMSVDGHLLKNDSASAIQALQLLETKSLSLAKKIGLYKKQVDVYLDAKQYDLAIAANEKLQAIISGNTTEAQLLTMAKEADELVEINAKQNGELAEVMVEKAKLMTNKFAQSIYYYRAAKCYYFKKNEAKVIKYLEEAKRKSSKGVWLEHIELCLKDHAKLLDK